jgi:hypothetical protein
MGVYFNAYIGHKFDVNGIKYFCELLNSGKFQAINKFLKDYYAQNENRDIFKVSSDPFTGTITVADHPDGLEFMFSEKVCRFSPYVLWQFFLTKEETQKTLREISFEVMAYFNSSFVIYVPDSGYIESGIMDFLWREEEEECKDIFYIQNWLMCNCGTPQKYIKDIYQKFDDYWDSVGYYIDAINEN